jgi:hypothetical protein
MSTTPPDAERSVNSWIGRTTRAMGDELQWRAGNEVEPGIGIGNRVGAKRTPASFPELPVVERIRKRRRL